MYTKHFDLTEEPFSIAANPRFLYMSGPHREALAHLLYGIRSDSGFVMLTGEVGTGKTTVCRSLMEQLPEHTNIAFILNPKVTVIELLGSICDEFGIDHAQIGNSVKSFVDAINRYLLDQNAEGRNTVIIIDEAQNLSIDVLEQLRLLTNLETNERKLVRIILLGQPELEDLLARPELKQVEQRITARYTLRPLERDEIIAYISHRLAVAGCVKPVFSPQVINKIYARTDGIPRLINILCDRAMLGAYVKSQYKVSPGILKQALKEVQGRSHRQTRYPNRPLVLASILLGVLVLALWVRSHENEVSRLLAQASAAQSVVKITDVEDPANQPPNQVALVEDQLAASRKQDRVAELANWPENINALTESNTHAHRVLFRQWNKDLDAGVESPCAQAMLWGLRCYSGVGNLGTLANSNRPAILTLLDNQGRPYQVTLLSLEDERATLAFAHGIEIVTLQELELRWQGQFQILWRLAPKGLSIFRPGETGSGIDWLTSRLRNAGINWLQVKDVYDAEVVEAVKLFQRNRGLLADGIAGRQTLMHLNSVNDETVPRLIREREA